MIINLFSTELKNIQTMEALNKVCTVAWVKWSMHKVGGRDRGANIIVDVYRCHPVKGCFLVGEEPEAHTFKWFEMIICTRLFVEKSEKYKTILHTSRPPSDGIISIVLGQYVSNTILHSQLLQFKQDFFNTLHDWLLQYEDYHQFERILSLLSQSFELYIVLNDTFIW